MKKVLPQNKTVTLASVSKIELSKHVRNLVHCVHEIRKQILLGLVEMYYLVRPIIPVILYI